MALADNKHFEDIGFLLHLSLFTIELSLKLA